MVYDLSAYPDATIEMVDFHHGSWGNTGTWYYKMHVVDWNTFTSIAEFGPFTTTGDDIYEIGVPLGSVAPNSNLVGVFMEPMSFDPSNAYPVLSCDESLQGLSVRVYIPDLTAYLVETADFLMDLWIFNPEDKKLVQAKKFKVDNTGNPDVRKPYTPVIGEITLNQKENVKENKSLTGYNVYYAHESEPFSFLDQATDTTYSHENAGLITGMHNYYVTSNYDEGESEPSNIASEYISGISENEIGNMEIYPNPILDVVTIETDQRIVNLQVINSNGLVVFEEQNINLNNTQIDLGKQASGIFNIRIETEEGWINRKIIKK
ncbi:MAG: T9SS type A sorting domain-containing protein [Bacteroidales bacterium]